MSDLAQRLRDKSKTTLVVSVEELCKEAADEIEAKDARIEELTIALLATGGELGKCQANRTSNLESLRRLEAEIAQLRADAARYRHIRNKDARFDVTIEDENEDGPSGAHYSLFGHELDAAIDAQIAGVKT